jgi:hypothetical protein
MVLATSRRAEAQTVSHPVNRAMRNLIARCGALAIPLDRVTLDDVRRFVDMRFPDHGFPAGPISASYAVADVHGTAYDPSMRSVPVAASLEPFDAPRVR